MANDLLEINEGVVKYTTQSGSGESITKDALLNESDELWSELRHQHIAKVIEVIKARMSDIIQNNASAALQKRTGSDVSITQMASVIRELPEFRQTMSKLGQHVAIAQQCMDAFTRESLIDISQLEQTMSTGLDEEGKEFRGAKLVQQLSETLRGNLSKLQKIRLLAIFVMSQRGVSGEDRGQLIRTARLTGPEQQIILNFEKLGQAMYTAQGPNRTGVFSGLFKGKSAAGGARAAPAATDGDYSNTRHIPEIRTILDQFITGELSPEKFHSSGPAAPVAGEAKVASVRTRRFGAETQAKFSGGRFLVFVAGGITYSEIRSISELEVQHKKEILIGGSHILNPKTYVSDVAKMDPSSESIADEII
jgi:syntaxin-binding protein 1